MSVTINVLIVNYNKIDLILQFFPLILHYFCQVTCWSWVKSFSPRPPTNPQLDWGLDSDVAAPGQWHCCFEVIPVPFWLHVWEHRLAGKQIFSRAAGAESISFSSWISLMLHSAQISCDILLIVLFSSTKSFSLWLTKRWTFQGFVYATIIGNPLTTHTRSPFTFVCKL